jgi:hypothetical protein
MLRPAFFTRQGHYPRYAISQSTTSLTASSSAQDRLQIVI